MGKSFTSIWSKINSIWKNPYRATNHSKIIDYREGTTIEDEEAFLEKLLALPDQEAEEGKVFIIHGCKDEYV
ncbi:MAG: hypothetical protein ACLS23_06515 [Clostridioides difficile]